MDDDDIDELFSFDASEGDGDQKNSDDIFDEFNFGDDCMFDKKPTTTTDESKVQPVPITSPTEKPEPTPTGLKPLSPIAKPLSPLNSPLAPLNRPLTPLSTPLSPLSSNPMTSLGQPPLFTAKPQKFDDNTESNDKASFGFNKDFEDDAVFSDEKGSNKTISSNKSSNKKTSNDASLTKTKSSNKSSDKSASSYKSSNKSTTGNKTSSKVAFTEKSSSKPASSTMSSIKTAVKKSSKKTPSSNTSSIKTISSNKTSTKTSSIKTSSAKKASDKVSDKDDIIAFDEDFDNNFSEEITDKKVESSLRKNAESLEKNIFGSTLEKNIYTSQYRESTDHDFGFDNVGWENNTKTPHTEKAPSSVQDTIVSALTTDASLPGKRSDHSNKSVIWDESIAADNDSSYSGNHDQFVKDSKNTESVDEFQLKQIPSAGLLTNESEKVIDETFDGHFNTKPNTVWLSSHPLEKNSKDYAPLEDAVDDVPGVNDQERPEELFKGSANATFVSSSKLNTTFKKASDDEFMISGLKEKAPQNISIEKEDSGVRDNHLTVGTGKAKQKLQTTKKDVQGKIPQKRIAGRNYDYGDINLQEKNRRAMRDWINTKNSDSKAKEKKVKDYLAEKRRQEDLEKKIRDAKKDDLFKAWMNDKKRIMQEQIRKSDEFKMRKNIELEKKEKLIKKSSELVNTGEFKDDKDITDMTKTEEFDRWCERLIELEEKKQSALRMLQETNEEIKKIQQCPNEHSRFEYLKWLNSSNQQEEWNFGLHAERHYPENLRLSKRSVIPYFYRRLRTIQACCRPITYWCHCVAGMPNTCGKARFSAFSGFATMTKLRYPQGVSMDDSFLSSPYRDMGTMKALQERTHRSNKSLMLNQDAWSSTSYQRKFSKVSSRKSPKIWGPLNISRHTTPIYIRNASTGRRKRNISF